MDAAALPSTATASPSLNIADLDDQVALQFQSAMPARKSQVLDTPWQQTVQPARSGSQSINIEKVFLQAEECETLFDFIKMMMQAVHKPEEEAV
jgi:hypothetical protein